jgi:hypothetical protein
VADGSERIVAVQYRAGRMFRNGSLFRRSRVQAHVIREEPMSP